MPVQKPDCQQFSLFILRLSGNEERNGIASSLGVFACKFFYLNESNHLHVKFFMDTLKANENRKINGKLDKLHDMWTQFPDCVITQSNER